MGIPVIEALQQHWEDLLRSEEGPALRLRAVTLLGRLVSAQAVLVRRRIALPRAMIFA